MAPKSVPRASRERLGSAPAHPGSARWVHKLTPGRQTECPGTPGHDQNWRQVAPRHEKIAFSLRGSFAKHGRIDFSPISVVFRLLREVCEPSEVPRLSANTRVRPHKRVSIKVERISARNLRNSSKFCTKFDNFGRIAPHFDQSCTISIEFRRV